MSSLESDPIDLSSRGIDDLQAADLRAHFATFAEDWESSEMKVYDDYDSAIINFRSAEAIFGQSRLHAQNGQTRPA